MADKTKNILSLNHKEAINFFLKSEQYHGFELPEYFVFDELLQNVKNAVGETTYEKCLNEGTSPEQLSDVNLDILLNKDGHYAVRPIILANPFLYYFLVREICNEQSWTIIKGLFEKFNVPHITSCALPSYQRKKNHSTSQRPLSIGGAAWNNEVLNFLLNTDTCLSLTSPIVMVRLIRKHLIGLFHSKELNTN